MHGHIFSRRPSLMTIDILLNGRMGMAFAPYGEHWRPMRKLCVNHLLSTNMVQTFRLVRQEEVASMIQEISQISNSSSGVVNMSHPRLRGCFWLNMGDECKMAT